jgi:P-type Ca2+ transporter type 2C
VLLEGGDVATAGLRLISASPLEADESVLTGESLPVAKSPEPMSRDAPLAERTSMVFKRTSVTRRSAETFVVATGMDSELGKISLLVEEAKEECTPLEERLDQLGRKLIWVVLLIAAVVTGGGVSGKEPLLMIQTSIALSVATEAPQRFSLQIS